MSIYLGTLPKFRRPARLMRPLGEDDAREAARLLTRGETEPTAADVAWLAGVLAAAYAPEGDPRAQLPDAASLGAVVREFGGWLVATAVSYAFFCGAGGQGVAKLTDPEVVRDLAEAMGVGAAEEERDDRARGPGASAGSEHVQSDGTRAGKEATLAARERAEYDRLRRRQKDAAALMQRLQRQVGAAERGSRHGNEVFSRLQLASEAY